MNKLFPPPASALPLTVALLLTVSGCGGGGDNVASDTADEPDRVLKFSEINSCLAAGQSNSAVVLTAVVGGQQQPVDVSGQVQLQTSAPSVVSIASQSAEGIVLQANQPGSVDIQISYAGDLATHYFSVRDPAEALPVVLHDGCAVALHTANGCATAQQSESVSAVSNLAVGDMTVEFQNCQITSNPAMVAVRLVGN